MGFLDNYVFTNPVVHETSFGQTVFDVANQSTSAPVPAPSTRPDDGGTGAAPAVVGAPSARPSSYLGYLQTAMGIIQNSPWSSQIDQGSLYTAASQAIPVGGTRADWDKALDWLKTATQTSFANYRPGMGGADQGGLGWSAEKSMADDSRRFGTAEMQPGVGAAKSCFPDAQVYSGGGGSLCLPWGGTVVEKSWASQMDGYGPRTATAKTGGSVVERQAAAAGSSNRSMWMWVGLAVGAFILVAAVSRRSSPPASLP